MRSLSFNTLACSKLRTPLGAVGCRVACFVDVDDSKVGRPYVNGGVPGSRAVPVRHWTDSPRGLPLVLCVSLGRTSGAFEANVRALALERGLVETADYWHFN